ncbi:MAG: type II toxin-antitoxin system prevent-host-death family antitoxin [Chloroflexota bacterium]
MPQIQPISRMARDHKSLLTMIEASPVFLTQRSTPVAVIVSPQEWQQIAERMAELEWREKVRQRVQAVRENTEPDLTLDEVMAELEARDKEEEYVA